LKYKNTQIKKFLSWHLLAKAAADARLRFTIVRTSEDADEATLRKHRFVPAGPRAPGMAYRLDLAELELPAEKSLKN